MRIYDAYFGAIYGFIRLRVDDPALAEDIASAVFLKLVEAARRGKMPRLSLRGWLFRVARSELAAHYQLSAQFPTTTLEEWIPDPSGDDVEAQFLRALDAERARRALRMLAADQQEVLILRFGQRLDLQATADVMGKSVSAVKSLQFRAINTLRAILGEMRIETAHG